MAHFAKLDENNMVIHVSVVDNENLLKDGVEDEQTGIDYLIGVHGGGTWKQTSYNNNIRKNYAGFGFTYDETRDAFIPPQPYPSWLLNEDTCRWESPVPYPEETDAEGNPVMYTWDEETVNWIEVTE